MSEDRHSDNIEPNTKLEDRISKLKTQNLRMMQGLKQAGVEADLAQPRVERLLWWLEQNGIITYEQRLDEQEQWELFLRSELQPAYQRLKAAASMSGAPRQTESGLVIPGVNAPRNVRE